MSSLSAAPTATGNPPAPARARWELVRCTNPDCPHEHPRQATGKRALPCLLCGSTMGVLPLSVPEGQTLVDPALTLDGVAADLRAAADRCKGLAVCIEDPAIRAAYHGRADGYLDAAEMVDISAAAQAPTRSSGVIGAVGR